MWTLTGFADEVADALLKHADTIRPHVIDSGRYINDALDEGKVVLFEGAQGTLLDVDHGTYPFVTSSNTVAGNAAAGAGVGPGLLHYVLGITKAYCTRVGGGQLPTEPAWWTLIASFSIRLWYSS